MIQITSLTFFNQQHGLCMSIVYSKVDEKGKIIQDTIRENRILLDPQQISNFESLKEHALKLINEE